MPKFLLTFTKETQIVVEARDAATAMDAAHETHWSSLENLFADHNARWKPKDCDPEFRKEFGPDVYIHADGSLDSL